MKVDLKPVKRTSVLSLSDSLKTGLGGVEWMWRGVGVVESTVYIKLSKSIKVTSCSSQYCSHYFKDRSNLKVSGRKNKDIEY